MKIFLYSLAILLMGKLVNMVISSYSKDFAVGGKVKLDYTKELKYEEVFPHVANINSFKNNKKISDEDIEQMKVKIVKYLGENINDTSICYYDINSGKGFNINENREFKAASTIKVPVSMMLYDAINKGEITEKDTIMFKNQDMEQGFGGLINEDLSKPKTFKHINESMIIYSDNVAVNMLLRYFGNQRRYNYIESIVEHKVNRTDNLTSAVDNMKILKKLYFDQEKNPYYTNIIELMKKTSFHERLDKLLPQDIVAHKIGDYSDNKGTYSHDIGIIYSDEPYILVVMTKNLNNSYDVIANISKIVYDIQTKQPLKKESP
ncbi:beta-lactamase class A [Clostridium punense]|uniref:Beta-lactamase class A n=2 Tax=Clostridium TaxID=1485 RepID=A0ABS4K7P1_9CLOT|nr:serine hydrolase [Clostridium punense]EQB85718.1 hypothetical protein M918_17860 [Clostridium sp. BL8]MBP2023819.1 beta-lactamase class A [Clostridium punense]